MTDAPERIWLQDDGDYVEAVKTGEITWCQNQVDESDTEYVRADILATAIRERDEARAEAKSLWKAQQDERSAHLHAAKALKSVLEGKSVRDADEIIERAALSPTDRKDASDDR